MLEFMAYESAVDALAAYASSYADDKLEVHRAAITLDERQDGEPISRVALLLSDPEGDTWDVERVRQLRIALGRKATELQLPPVTLTLVAESETDAAQSFAP